VKTAFFDCFSGAAGDMIVASLLDAGAPKDALLERLESLGLCGYTISIDKTVKQGFSATRFNVELDENLKQPHRNLQDVVEILSAGSLPEPVRTRACAVFRRLAEAEAAVHGTTTDKIHFHEVGAVDAILDIVAAVSCLELLGIGRVFCSPVVTGMGTVYCAHGLLPVPAPATAELIKGVPLRECRETGELLTPTGAAVLTTVAEYFGPLPAMRIESIGCGAGVRDGNEVPNVLRVFVGEGQSEGEGETDTVTVLETTIDDSSPEMIGHCVERLLGEGVLEAYTMPIHMKKSRTGLLLTVLCEQSKIGAVERIIFAETTTFGIRRHSVERTKLRRRIEEVQTPFGPVRMKVGERPGIITVSPEYEDCRQVANQRGVPLQEVMSAARDAFNSGNQPGTAD